MKLTARLLTLMLGVSLMLFAFGCGSMVEERAEEPAPEENSTVEETTIIERTVYQTVIAEPDEPEEQEEADAIVGERVLLSGVAFQLFDSRTENTVYYVSSPASPFASKGSVNGEYLVVDYFARNESGGETTISPDATLTDSDGETYEVDAEIEPPTEDSGGFTVNDDEFLSSSFFFDVPEGISPETLTLRFDGDEAVVDLTSRNADELDPVAYLSIYTLWFDQRAYDDIYSLLEPSSTQGISEGEWVSYFEPLWGEWYLSLERVDFDTAASTDSQSFALMERNFYESSGAVTNSPVEQELIKYSDEWRLIMRQDQVDDILGIEPYVPAEPTPEETTAAPPVEQYDPPDPDLDPDPDPDRPYVPNRPGGGGSNNTPSYPSDGYYEGAPDKDCSDFSGGVTVSPGDPYGLDGDGDGIACE